MAPVAVLDVDGTLVDSNYQHALAWYRAFRACEIVLPLWRIHRHIGMGGDQIVAALTDEATEERIGDQLREREGDLYKDLIGEVEPLSDARALIRDLKDAGHVVVLASSAKEDEIEHYVDLLDVRGLADAWTTSDDVEQTKPAPDLVEAALAKGGGGPAAMLGDTPWDCKAAERAGIRAATVLTGGFGREELREAGAAAIYETLAELRADLAQSPLGDPA